MNWLDVGGHRSKFKVTAGRRGGEGIHVDAGEVHLLVSSIFASPLVWKRWNGSWNFF